MDNFITANPTQCRVFGDGGKIDWTNSVMKMWPTKFNQESHSNFQRIDKGKKINFSGISHMEFGGKVKISFSWIFSRFQIIFNENLIYSWILIFSPFFPQKCVADSNFSVELHI